ncbi:D-alanyl-D-alanine carboxypeptidase, partial [Megasphaera massiliensis]|nr:D-alanyl-D-alanine carboxypeptidase [Megasphaera massiliensis]
MLTRVIAIGLMIGSMTVTAQAEMPQTIAESACMIDIDTGNVLYQVNPTKWVDPASTTKLVTLITALDEYKDKLD